MDSETKNILRHLHAAVAELSRISRMAFQTSHPTFNESTVRNLMAPIDTSLANVLERLNQNEPGSKRN